MQGIDVEQDYKAAFDIFEKLSKQEHAQSQYILGMMYQKGQAVQENQQLAFQYFKKSAD